MDSIFKTTEEIALIPVELSYFKKPSGLRREDMLDSWSINKILNNVVEINFSKPMLVSDFTFKSESISYMSEMINARWKSDSIIFPHHIFCRIIKENNYTVPLNNVKSIVRDFLSTSGLKSQFTPNEIVNGGHDFILSNDIGTIVEDKIVITEKDEVDYYSNLVYG